MIYQRICLVLKVWLVGCLYMTVGDRTSLLPSFVQRVDSAGCSLDTPAWHSVVLFYKHTPSKSRVEPIVPVKI